MFVWRSASIYAKVLVLTQQHDRKVGLSHNRRKDHSTSSIAVSHAVLILHNVCQHTLRTSILDPAWIDNRQHIWFHGEGSGQGLGHELRKLFSRQTEHQSYYLQTSSQESM